jgi:hypothetical protein
MNNHCFKIFGSLSILLLITSFIIAFISLLKKHLFSKYSNGRLILPGNPLKDHKIDYIANIILFGFIAAVLFHLTKSVILGGDYPNNTFLFIPSDRFNDFVNGYSICKGLNPYFTHYFLHSSYYPFANIIMYLFTFLPNPGALLVYLAGFSIFFIYINASNLLMASEAKYLKNLIIFSYLTYPFLFALDRANMEIIVFIFLFLFLHYYGKKRFITSSIFLSFAIAMKVFPAVFLVILLSDKRYKEIALTIGLVIFLTAASLIFHKGGFFLNFNFILSGFNFNNVSFMCHNNNIVQRGVSLFTLAKMYFIQTGIIGSIDLVKFLGIYTKAVFSLFILLSGYVLFIEKELWKKAMILLAAALLFPHVSSEPKLLHVFIPLFLFINLTKKGKFDLFYMIMFGLLLIPKDYYLFPKIISDAGCSDISIAVVLNIMILIAMMSAIIIDGTSRVWCLRRDHAN